MHDMQVLKGAWLKREQAATPMGYFLARVRLNLTYIRKKHVFNS
jgi:hypothetical protein